MPDKSLGGQTFKVSDKVREVIKVAYDSFDGPETTEGYVRAKNILKDPIISLSLLKKINNFFRNADESSWSYRLTGGDKGKKFFAHLEEKTRSGEEANRKTKSQVLDNQYRDIHTKDSVTVDTTKVVVPRVDTGNSLREEINRINKLINS
tara:strand:- start:80 stop:529 length:450 start_codon:yes stop_codon:yes gene_type:complete